MKWFFTVLFFLCYGDSFSQIDPNWKNAVVSLYNCNMKEGGWGLIIGNSGDSTFILTAHHVVGKSICRLNIQIPMKIEGSRDTINVRLIAGDVNLDYALIGFKGILKGFPVPTIKNIDIEREVYFVKTLKGRKVIYPTSDLKPGIIESSDPENHLFFVSIQNLQSGDSGSVFLCQAGVAGIVKTNGSEAEFVDIAWVKSLIEKKWKFKYWQLPEIKIQN